MAEFVRTFDRYREQVSTQQIPRSAPFAGIDRSAAPRFTYRAPAADTQRLAGVRVESGWLDELDDWPRAFLSAEVQRAPEPRTPTTGLARAGLAKLDAEEAALAERTKHLGIHNPEPLVTATPIWSSVSIRRFNDCSCELCESGRNWNAWAARTNQLRSPYMEDPRIRQRAERGENAGL